MSDELKPCSCGSTDTSICYESPQGYWVECGDCGRQTEKSHGRDLAIAAWSRRAQPAEAEGVEVVAYAYIDETPEDYLRTKSFVLFAGPDGGAPGPAMAHQRLEALVRLSALQAVTAERDRLVANIERLTSNPADHRYWEGRYRDEAAANDQLRAEVEGMRKDAERLNWLDDQYQNVVEGVASNAELVAHRWVVEWPASSVREAIDAMAAKEA